jgi:ferredoxin
MAEVTIEIDGRRTTAAYSEGTTILQMARQMGLRPPSQCEAGNCATCMARVLDGSAEMRVNDALDDDEVAEGWILTCQAQPTTETILVKYGFEGD